jgi:hypothetical protein
MNSPILHPPDDLIASLQEQDCVLFAGAELSAIAGSPTTRTILERLLDFATRRGLIDEKLRDLLTTGLAEGQYSSVAEALVSRTWRDDTPPVEVVEILRDMFSNSSVFKAAESLWKTAQNSLQHSSNDKL